METRNLAPDKAAVRSILAKFGRDDREASNSLALLTFNQLYAGLNLNETATVEWLLNLKPEMFGFFGPQVSREEAPASLVKVEGQTFLRSGETITIPAQYLPEQALEAFRTMQAEIVAEINGSLLIESGYRSLACQVITFLTYLELFNFNLEYVASGVALPGYSQHGDPVNTAVDVITSDGVPTDEYPQLFAHAPEYSWLLNNAHKYDFYLSYPEGNEDGIKFEPWHWRWSKKETDNPREDF